MPHIAVGSAQRQQRVDRCASRIDQYRSVDELSVVCMGTSNFPPVKFLLIEQRNRTDHLSGKAGVLLDHAIVGMGDDCTQKGYSIKFDLLSLVWFARSGRHLQL